jgi:hypothetical protein
MCIFTFGFSVSFREGIISFSSEWYKASRENAMILFA